MIGINNPLKSNAPVDIIIDGWKYKIPVGETYSFDDRVAFVILERYPFLKKVDVKKDTVISPRERPTEREAPLLYKRMRDMAKNGESPETSQFTDVPARVTDMLASEENKRIDKILNKEVDNSEYYGPGVEDDTWK